MLCSGGSICSIVSAISCGNFLSSVSILFLYFLIGEQPSFLLFFYDCVTLNPILQIKAVIRNDAVCLSKYLWIGLSVIIDKIFIARGLQLCYIVRDRLGESSKC